MLKSISYNIGLYCAENCRILRRWRKGKS